MLISITQLYFDKYRNINGLWQIDAKRELIAQVRLILVGSQAEQDD